MNQSISQAPFIEIDHVSKCYYEGDNQRCVLIEACGTMQAGEFVAVLGKSGSGKSTLLNVISGIDLVDSGSISLARQVITAMNENERTLYRRKNIGFIFQFFNLLPTLTVLENVMLPGELVSKSKKNVKEAAISLLDQVELADRLQAYPDRLSGGEQQRVAIARAFINNPQLVLADEPTGNLDEQTGKLILTLIDRLTRQAGKNVILVTHNRESARYADRILNLQNGRLIEYA
jgi:putative ABC transport system ATP-binding protein